MQNIKTPLNLYKTLRKVGNAYYEKIFNNNIFTLEN
jgi:hypothetical protein